MGWRQESRWTGLRGPGQSQEGWKRLGRERGSGPGFEKGFRAVQQGEAGGQGLQGDRRKRGWQEERGGVVPGPGEGRGASRAAAKATGQRELASRAAAAGASPRGSPWAGLPFLVPLGPASPAPAPTHCPAPPRD